MGPRIGARNLREGGCGAEEFLEHLAPDLLVAVPIVDISVMRGWWSGRALRFGFRLRAYGSGSRV